MIEAGNPENFRSPYWVGYPSLVNCLCQALITTFSFFRDAATRTLAESAERRQDRPQASSSGTPLTQLPPGNPTSSARSTSESAAAIMARLQPPSSAAGAEGGGGHHEVAKVAVNDSLDVVVRKLRGVTQVLLTPLQCLRFLMRSAAVYKRPLFVFFSGAVHFCEQTTHYAMLSATNQ